MLTLINTNRMTPPIAPIGLDYLAGALGQAGIEVDIIDLALTGKTQEALEAYFAHHEPELVGLSFRNTDDCFWPSGQWFVPELDATVRTLQRLTDAPIVIGGVGFSIFAEQILNRTGVDFGIRGDGEHPLLSLLEQLRGRRFFDQIEGLIWRDNGHVRTNRSTWSGPLSLATVRNAVDNSTYFRRGGQVGLETKRGCNRNCIYCPEPFVKGTAARLRNPAEVADEVESLLGQGIDVLHLCDSEFNIPASHAADVCAEFIRRGLGRRVRWYTYMAVVPFEESLAAAMRKAGCVGIDFTADSADPAMLKTYRQQHRREDIASAVRRCRENGIAVMLDLMIGGPGETTQSLAESINFFKRLDADCLGAALGVRIYPHTAMAKVVLAEGTLQTDPSIRRKYKGPVDLFQPTFYLSHALGEKPAQLVRDLIGGDERFFEPTDEIASTTAPAQSRDHNYSDNSRLVKAIAAGARGAYWDILRQLRNF